MFDKKQMVLLRELDTKQLTASGEEAVMLEEMVLGIDAQLKLASQ